MAAQLSKAEFNVDRKLEMIQILRAQLDDADQNVLLKGPGDRAERMKMQETLMSSQAGRDFCPRAIQICPDRARCSGGASALTLPRATPSS